jgi:hypothetical protein
MKNNILPIVGGVLIVAIVIGIIARNRLAVIKTEPSDAGGIEHALYVTEIEQSKIFTDDVVSAYKDAERVNVELVERTTIEDGKNSETLYDTYVVSDVDLSNGTDNTADYHHELSESDELDIDGEDIPFRDAFGISYKGLDGYELYEKLLEEKGFSAKSLKGSLDEDFYKLTGVKSYLVENDAPIKKLLAGETYDEILKRKVSVGMSENGMPEYFNVEVTYRFEGWTITKSLYLQVSIEDIGKGDLDEA